jgi:hypothetical protein
MFKNAAYNVQGVAPFNPKAFPMVIATGHGFCDTMPCHSPDDIPRGVDFVILASGVAKSVPQTGDLDGGVPNHTDPTKRGFDPR